MIGNDFKFLWSRSCKAENGVGVILANLLMGSSCDLRGIMIESDEGHYCYWGCSKILPVSCYCPEAGKSVNEKEEFYDLMDRR